MDKIISDKFGCQIIKRGYRFFIRYDGGHFAVKMVEKEITSEDAERAMISEQEAYKVIVGAIKRERDQS